MFNTRVSDPDPEQDPPRSVSFSRIQIRIHKTFEEMDPKPVEKPTKIMGKSTFVLQKYCSP